MSDVVGRTDCDQLARNAASALTSRLDDHAVSIGGLKAGEAIATGKRLRLAERIGEVSEGALVGLRSLAKKVSALEHARGAWDGKTGEPLPADAKSFHARLSALEVNAETAPIMRHVPSSPRCPSERVAALVEAAAHSRTESFRSECGEWITVIAQGATEEAARPIKVYQVFCGGDGSAPVVSVRLSRAELSALAGL